MAKSIITVSYNISGVMGEDHIREFFEQMALIAKKDHSINLIMEIYHIDELRSINQFLSDTISREKVQKHLRKFALIADANWIEELGDFIDLLNPEMEVKVFDYDETKAANTWVQARTKIEDRDLQERVRQGYAHLVNLG